MSKRRIQTQGFPLRGCLSEVQRDLKASGKCSGITGGECASRHGPARTASRARGAENRPNFSAYNDGFYEAPFVWREVCSALVVLGCCTRLAIVITGSYRPFSMSQVPAERTRQETFRLTLLLVLSAGSAPRRPASLFLTPPLRLSRELLPARRTGHNRSHL
jgi:hypothetical protein